MTDMNDKTQVLLYELRMRHEQEVHRKFLVQAIMEMENQCLTQ